MRFDRLALAPYGRFADREIAFSPDASLHVVFGANESGKTTTLSAIGDLLFGFPARTSYGFDHDQGALRVGGSLRLADGAAIDVRRRKGTKNTLLGADDKPIAEDTLSRALGAVTREIFAAEFGLTAEALRAGGRALLDAGGGLAETLAASSAGLSALSRLRQRLERDADELFTSRRAASKPFYVALDRHDAAEKQLREAVVTAEALRAAETAVVEAEASEVDLRNQHAESGRALARWQRAFRTRGKLARLEAIAAELAALPALPEVEAASLAEWRAALAEAQRLEAEKAALAAEDEAGAAAAAALPRDEALLAKGAAIEALHARLSAVRQDQDDLPRREAALRSAVATLDDLARRLGLDGNAALVQAAPSEAALARAQAALEARRRAEERRRELEERRRVALAELEALPEAGPNETADPAPLRRRFDALTAFAVEADRLRRERAGLDRARREIEEGAARLSPSPGGLDALARLPLPDEARLVELLRAREENGRQQAAALDKAAEAEKALRLAEEKAGRLEGDGAGATRAAWHAARRERERGFDRLEASLEAPPETRRASLESVRALSAAADVLAEGVLADSERAARLEAAREGVAARAVEVEALRAAFEAALAAGQAIAGALDALWAPSGLRPSEADMLRWRREAGALLARREEEAGKSAELTALAERVSEASAAVRRLIQDLGAEAPVEAGFEAALAEARARLEGREAAAREARDLRMARQRAERGVADAQKEGEKAEAALAAALAEWPAAMAGVGLRADAGSVEGEAALAVWKAVPVPLRDMQSEQGRAQGMAARIAAFEAEVVALAGAVAPDLAGAAPGETLVPLMTRLTARRRDADAAARLAEAAGRRGQKRKALETRIQAVRAAIGAAETRLGVDGAAAVLASLPPIERRGDLRAEAERLRRDLAEIGDGLDEAALRAEQEGIDPDALAGDVALGEARQTELLHEIGEAAAARRAAEQRLEALTLGRNAAEAARERAEASGELLDIAEKWLLRQAAARLAARAIERHRAAAQDPLVKRAGEMFALATGGAFSGLGADYDEADRPVLVAVRRTGVRVKVEGLSEGARDQLFLGLRLALLERRAGEPLPFIGDDILASFDDDRTRRTLDLLAEFGRGRQVIVFTHHRHVAELAATAAGAEVIGLA